MHIYTKRELIVLAADLREMAAMEKTSDRVMDCAVHEALAENVEALVSLYDFLGGQEVCRRLLKVERELRINAEVIGELFGALDVALDPSIQLTSPAVVGIN